MRYFSSRKARTYLLFTILGLVSAYQATILLTDQLVTELVTSGFQSGQHNGKYIPFHILQQYLQQQDLFALGLKTWLTAVKLLIVQIIPLLIYTTRSRIRARQWIALGFWLGPGLITLPTIVGPWMYFFAGPLFALDWPSNFWKGFGVETSMDGWGAFAVIGCFHLFWFSMTIYSHTADDL